MYVYMYTSEPPRSAMDVLYFLYRLKNTCNFLNIPFYIFNTNIRYVSTRYLIHNETFLSNTYIYIKTKKLFTIKLFFFIKVTYIRNNY